MCQQASENIITLTAEWKGSCLPPKRNRLTLEGLPGTFPLYKFDIPKTFMVRAQINHAPANIIIERFQFVCWPAPEIPLQQFDTPFYASNDKPYHRIFRDGFSNFTKCSSTPGSFVMDHPKKGMEFVKNGRFSFTITLMVKDLDNNNKNNNVRFFRVDPEMETDGVYPDVLEDSSLT